MPNKGKNTKKTVKAAAKQAAVAAAKAVEKQHTKQLQNVASSGKKTVPKKEIKKMVDGEVKKKLRKIDGPKSQYQVSVAATLGYVTGNESHGPNLKLTSFLHPALCKSPDESTNFGPLQAAAAQYGLWRVTRAYITLTPLVGPSAVSGTLIRGSVNLSQSPSSTGWGGLGARKHLDLQAGVKGYFKLARRDLAGPRDGGWWVTDTNVEGQQSAGPVFEIHALGQSTSTYQATDFKRELYIVEMRATWQFANYVSNPSMGLLERKEAETKVSFTTTEQKEIVMNVETDAGTLRFLDDPTVERAAGGQPDKPGEIIWQLADTAAEAITTVIPPPFGWLARGGWWFVKKIAGRAAYGFNASSSASFLVYPSLADAQNNRPAIANGTQTRSNQVPASLQFTQMNAPNMGGPTPGTSVMARGQFPVPPEKPPTSGACIFRTVLRPVFSSHGRPSFPTFFLGGTISWQRTTMRCAHFAAGHPVAINIPNDEILAFGAPDNGTGGVITLMNIAQEGNTMRELYPEVIAQRHEKVANNMWMHAFLWVAPKNQRSYRWRAGNFNITVGYLYTGIHSGQYMVVNSNGIDNEQMSFNAQNANTIGDQKYLSICFSAAKNAGPEINWAAQTFPFALNDSVPMLFSFLFMHQYLEGFKYWFELDMTQRRLGRLQRMARMLGLRPEDFESDTDEDDLETCSEDESDAEEKESTTSEFDVIPQPGGANDYMMLREQGLSHQEALDVIVAKKPAV
ncbi:capsid protein precursor [Mamastrovirus 14]|uniref:Capsid protein n=1 Tax=Mamastrovirus 14 TaxID=1239578 RepID=C6ZFI2_9VIRU|nr:capsid protein precursor [Mamastrovirus 14]ACU30844.1 capsid protein precursor [Mamastrovirus 14]